MKNTLNADLASLVMVLQGKCEMVFLVCTESVVYACAGDRVSDDERTGLFTLYTWQPHSW